MNVVSTWFGDVPLLVVHGDLDHSCAAAFDLTVQKKMYGRSRLLVDLTDCPYIDSGGLAVLLTAVQHVPANGWLGVVGCDRNVLRLFQLVGLTVDPLFRVFATLDEVSESAPGANV